MFNGLNILQITKRIGTIILNGRFDYLIYKTNARIKGLDLDYVSLENLGLSTDRSNRHEETGGPRLKRVLKTLDIQKSNRALDLGSGKGGAVLTLSMFPFSEIVGVEISDSLIGIAEANVAKMGLRNVHFVSCDAGEFTDLDRFTHIYMANPFPQPVVKEVMDNLSASLYRRSRNLTLIYCHPVCHDVIMNSGLFKIHKQLTFSPVFISIFTLMLAPIQKRILWLRGRSR